jgi:hypothetical protein
METTPTTPKTFAGTREEWLEAITNELREDFAAVGAPLPERVRVACGFTSKGKRSNRIGECWAPEASEAGVPEVFIVPGLADSIDVGAILVHELVHAAGIMNHGPAFRRVAVALGLEGKMTATVPGEACKARLAELVERVGAYPHARLAAAVTTTAKTQTTRMLKVVCPDPECGYTLRTTAKWIAVGLPTCPCGCEMVAPDLEAEEAGE